RSYSSPPPSWCSGLWDRLLGIPCEEDAEPAPAVALSAARDPTVDGVGHEDRVDGVEPVDQRDRLRLALVVGVPLPEHVVEEEEPILAEETLVECVLRERVLVEMARVGEDQVGWGSVGEALQPVHPAARHA